MPNWFWGGVAAGSVVLGVIVILIMLLVSGCGAQVSNETRSQYALAAARCLADQQAIIDEPCGELTEEACSDRDYTHLAEVRARCDSDLLRIEQADSTDGGTP